MGKTKIVYEDNFLLVADKPSGLLTVATPKKEKNVLASLLNAYPAHRLDRETSGLVILAKHRDMQEKLVEQFRKRKVKKRYIAFVQGELRRNKGLISRYVQDNPQARAKHARTFYRVLNQRAGFAIVEVIPITGRTNQIRIHFKQIGHPLLGERRFAFAKDYKIKFRRVALHASDLEFFHPITHKKMALHSDLPQDMQDFMR